MFGNYKYKFDYNQYQTLIWTELLQVSMKTSKLDDCTEKNKTLRPKSSKNYIWV